MQQQKVKGRAWMMPSNLVRNYRELVDVLTGFHSAPVALTGDISEMFLQVSIPEKDGRYYRFLWRFHVRWWRFGLVWGLRECQGTVDAADTDAWKSQFIPAKMVVQWRKSNVCKVNCPSRRQGLSWKKGQRATQDEDSGDFVESTKWRVFVSSHGTRH